MKIRNKLLIILISFLISVVSINAQNYGIGLKINTLGFNAEVIRSFGNNINLRLGGAYFSISPDGNQSENDFRYNANVNLLSAYLLGDYFPFGNEIRITAGFRINLNKAELQLIPTNSYTVGGDTYDPESLGSLNALVDFNRFAPYIGLGIGNPMRGRSHFQFTFDAGTMYQGGARVDLTANGLLEPSAAPDQEKQLEDNLSWFKWYPVLSFGIVYKF